MKEKWDIWNPSNLITKDSFLETIAYTNKGIFILFKSLNKEKNKIKLNFYGDVVLYRVCDEGVRLNLYEDLAYRRLLDLYYLNERPFNGCSTDVAREIGMLDSLTDVEYVLNKFFTEKNNAWHNKRCDREIKAYQSKQKTAKKAGIASGIARKKKERPLNDR